MSIEERVSPDIDILSYMGLPDKCLRRAQRSIHVLETLWLYGPLTFTDIRRILHSVYGERVSDKVLDQILDSLRSSSLISDVVAEVSGGKKKFYVITGRGARGVMALRLADYMNKEYLRHIVGDDKEYYDYVKALAYTYYMSPKKIRTVGEIATIIVGNIKAFEKVAEITVRCLDEEYMSEKQICLKRELMKKEKDKGSEDEKKEYREILSRFIDLLRKQQPHCGSRVDSIILHVTRNEGKVEVYSGYYYRWNPVYAVASILTIRKLDYARCSSLLYIKGDLFHVSLALELLAILIKNRRMYKLFAEEILDEYYAEYGDSADATNPYSDYDIGYDIRPRDTVVLIEGSHIRDRELLIDLSKLSDIIGGNVLVVAKGLRKLRADIPVKNITVIQEVMRSSISLDENVSEKNSESILLDISIKHRGWFEEFIRRIDIYLIYREAVAIKEAVPRLLLENIMYSPIDKPALIIWRGRCLHSIYAVPEPPGCTDKEFLIGKIIDVAREDPHAAFDRIKGFIEEYVVKPVPISGEKVSSGKIDPFTPICKVEKHEVKEYVSGRPMGKLVAKGPLVRIVGNAGIQTQTYEKIVVHVLMPDNNGMRRENRGGK